MMIEFILNAYLLLLVALIANWYAVASKYRIKWTGSRWVVRDSKGRFVRITNNPWNVLSLI